MEYYQFFIYILIGFIAQTVDGALGMAYGVCSTTFLTAVGVPIRIASASVHTAEVFTTLVSGISHWKCKNIDFSLFKSLIIPVTIGGVLGAYVLVNVSGEALTPFIAIYLIIMGFVVIYRALKGFFLKKFFDYKKVWAVGLIGGFCDAVGGGGWGPIVTSTMLVSSYKTRFVIGTVNTAEFFVTIVQSFTFAVFMGIGDYWQVILGLAVGGALAAPLAALVCKRLADKKLTLIVGIFIVVLNTWNILKYFAG